MITVNPLFKQLFYVLQILELVNITKPTIEYMVLENYVSFSLIAFKHALSHTVLFLSVLECKAAVETITVVERRCRRYFR